MKTIKRVLTMLCGLAVLMTMAPAFADDGFSTSYTYTYDYWEDVQESPDAYRVATIIDSISLGLEKLGNTRIKNPQSLFVQGDRLYLCDTDNNRILEIRKDGSEYILERVINNMFGAPEKFAAEGTAAAAQTSETVTEETTDQETETAAETTEETADETSTEQTTEEETSAAAAGPSAVGTWYLTQSTAEGISIDLAGSDIFVVIEIRDDQSFTFSEVYSGQMETLSGTWKENGAGATLVMPDGSELNCDVSGSKMEISAAGTVMTLAKSIPSSGSKIAGKKTGIKADAFKGDFYLSKSVAMGAVISSAEQDINLLPKISFDANGNVTESIPDGNGGYQETASYACEFDAGNACLVSLTKEDSGIVIRTLFSRLDEKTKTVCKTVEYGFEAQGTDEMIPLAAVQSLFVEPPKDEEKQEAAVTSNKDLILGTWYAIQSDPKGKIKRLISIEFAEEKNAYTCKDTYAGEVNTTEGTWSDTGNSVMLDEATECPIENGIISINIDGVPVQLNKAEAVAEKAEKTAGAFNGEWIRTDSETGTKTKLTIRDGLILESVAEDQEEYRDGDSFTAEFETNSFIRQAAGAETDITVKSEYALLKDVNNTLCRYDVYECGGTALLTLQTQYKENVGNKFSQPYDISVDPEGTIYVADYGNQRIIKMDKDLNYQATFSKPSDATFDQSLQFLPKKIVTDVAGRVYALCQNVNKGLVKYEADGAFAGFIGANTVSVSMGEYIWKRYFMTKEQRAQSESFVPTEYENIYIDPEGFIYATNTVFDEGDLLSDSAKPIRRLNSMGTDILIKNDRYPPIGDLDWVYGTDNASKEKGPSRFADITVLRNDIYVAIDRTRGRLFGYDSQGVMLWAFGTKGPTDGAFTTNGAVSIEHMDYDLFVLDRLKNTITVFTPTEYGQKIYDATETYLNGEYDESSSLWQDVLKMNANYPLAFRGIGRSILRQNKYQEAMEYFELAHDQENYGRAFKLYRKEWIEKNVWWIILIIAALLIIPIITGRIRRMKWEVSEHERSKVRK